MSKSHFVLSQWTLEQILALAPDPSSAKSGQELASARKWQNLGKSDTAVWGECQGSGKLPYQTQVDLSEPAFKCTCPSRKFPCKHGLGLMLLLAKEPAAFATGEPPAWVAEWLTSRSERAAKKEEKATDEKAAASDPAAQAKRQAQREGRVAAGLAELRLFLNDLVRQGIADLPARRGKVWDDVAARMVDAQAPGIARLLRETSSAVSSGAGWQDRVLRLLGKLHLAIEGWDNRANLSLDELADLRAVIGWTVPQEEVLVGAGVRDTWAVVGQHVEEEDRLRVQRTWLVGENLGRQAVVLGFAHGNAPLDTSLVRGTGIDASLVFFPSAAPLRAVIQERFGPPKPIDAIPGTAGVVAARAGWAGSLARCPWIERYGMALKDVQPVRSDAGWIVRDRDCRTLPISVGFERGWHLMAIAGGRPVDLFGEWDGERLLPLGVCKDGRFIGL